MRNAAPVRDKRLMDTCVISPAAPRGGDGAESDDFKKSFSFRFSTGERVLRAPARDLDVFFSRSCVYAHGNCRNREYIYVYTYIYTYKTSERAPLARVLSQIPRRAHIENRAFILININVIASRGRITLSYLGAIILSFSRRAREVPRKRQIGRRCLRNAR